MLATAATSSPSVRPDGCAESATGFLRIRIADAFGSKYGIKMLMASYYIYKIYIYIYILYIHKEREREREKVFPPGLLNLFAQCFDHFCLCR